MIENYGAHFQYQDFAPLFKCENFNASEWATLFRASGAQGLTVTSKHHEGWTLWPNPRHANWNAVDTGPHRDLLEELGVAMRAEGLKYGFYYSLMQWDRTYTDDTGTEDQRGNGSAYVTQVMIPDLKDLVTKFEPDVLYTDGEWSYDSEHWQTKPFLAWLFNESPVRDKVAINDRWGNDCRGKHGGFYVCEYGGEVDGSCITDNPTHPWTSHEGMGKSFGYNAIDEYKPAAYFVSLLAQSVAFGGHLQLNVGPTADGRVPQVQQDILLVMGRWLEVNGAAIFNTTGYPFGVAKGCTTSGSAGTLRQCYTKSESGDIYVMTSGVPQVIEFPAGTMQHPVPSSSQLSMVGVGPHSPLGFKVSVHNQVTTVSVGTIPVSMLPAASVESQQFVFKVSSGTN